jgi:hypothetical protein
MHANKLKTREQLHPSQEQECLTPKMHRRTQHPHAEKHTQTYLSLMGGIRPARVMDTRNLVLSLIQLEGSERAEQRSSRIRKRAHTSTGV